VIAIFRRTPAGTRGRRDRRRGDVGLRAQMLGHQLGMLAQPIGLALEKWRGLILNFGSEGGFDGSGEAGQGHG
jgi:hypothetical protein